MQQFLFSPMALDSRKRMPPVHTPRGFTARRVSRTRWDGIVSVIFEVKVALANEKAQTRSP